MPPKSLAAALNVSWLCKPPRPRSPQTHGSPLATPEHITEQWRHLQTLIPSEGPVALPLFGVPFAAKDNIDVAGLPTTAACPAFASGHVARDATVIARLRAAGAIVLGKTNLDQVRHGTSSVHARPLALSATRLTRLMSLAVRARAVLSSLHVVLYPSVLEPTRLVAVVCLLASTISLG